MNEEVLRSTKKSRKFSNKSRNLNEAKIVDIALLLEKEAQILQFYSLGAVKFQDKKLGEILSLRAGLLERMLDFANSCGLGATPPENSSEALATKGMNEFLASALLIEKKIALVVLKNTNAAINLNPKIRVWTLPQPYLPDSLVRILNEAYAFGAQNGDKI